ncbi:hypothetical protein [Nostoc sp. DSM 114159]|jgi:hypothetical protein
MVQIIQGKDITLAQLIDEFGLQLADNEDFFSEDVLKERGCCKKAHKAYAEICRKQHLVSE